MASGGDGLPIPLIMDTFTFDMRQEQRLKDMEKNMQDEVRKKKKEWEQVIDKMRVEFLTLHPSDKEWGSDELVNDPLICKRRGSTEVLDPKKMKTMFLEYPDTGRRFKLRFNLQGYDEKTIQISTDAERIVVRAIKHEEDETGKTVSVNYHRKIEKPREVDASKLKCYFTQDSILIVEAPTLISLNLRKFSNSPSSHGSCQSSHASSRSRSPPSSPSTPKAAPMPRYGVAQFNGNEGETILNLIVDIGHAFKPKDITVQVIKDNQIQVKAKNELRTSDRFVKNKFFKEWELAERIEKLSIRGGLTDDGKLIVGALCKGHPLFNKKDAQESAANLEKDIHDKNNTVACNVLNLGSFAPVPATAGSSSTNSESNG